MNTENIDVNMNDLEHFVCSLGETVFLEMDEIEDIRYSRDGGAILVLRTNGAKFKISVAMENTIAAPRDESVIANI